MTINLRPDSINMHTGSIIFDHLKITSEGPQDYLEPGIYYSGSLSTIWVHYTDKTIAFGSESIGPIFRMVTEKDVADYLDFDIPNKRLIFEMDPEVSLRRAGEDTLATGGNFLVAETLNIGDGNQRLWKHGTDTIATDDKVIIGSLRLDGHGGLYPDTVDAGIYFKGALDTIWFHYYDSTLPASDPLVGYGPLLRLVTRPGIADLLDYDIPTKKLIFEADKEVCLYREGEDTLTTDGDYHVKGDLIVDGSSPGGANSLSELSIDVTKDWQGYGITNLGTLEFGAGAANLYLVGSVIRSNNAISSKRSNASDNAFGMFVDGDNYYRIAITAGGSIEFGNGNNPRDCSIYRKGVNTLRTDDDFVFSYGIYIGNEPTIMRSGEFIALHPREQEHALAYYDSPYFVARSKTIHPRDPTTGDIISNFDQHASWISARQFGYGTYTWIAKLGEEDNRIGVYLGLFEHRHGWANEGIIGILFDQNSYKLQVGWNGNITNDALSGQDWTSDTTFEVIWNSGSVILSVDGSPESTVTTNIPQDSMSLLVVETVVYSYEDATVEATGYFKKKSFYKHPYSGP